MIRSVAARRRNCRFEIWDFKVEVMG